VVSVSEPEEKDMAFSATRLALTSAAAVRLLVVSPAVARKPKLNEFSVRGHGPFTVGTNPTCGCVEYQGTLTGLSIPPFGKNVNLDWNLFHGNKIASTPSGGGIFSVDGSGQFLVGSFQENLNWSGTEADLEQLAFFKLAAALSPGNSAEAQLFGVLDASMVLDLNSSTAYYEWDGNVED
jgi:hypothetical protein